MIQMRPVLSSHIEKIGYEASTQQLVVEFDTGRRVAYVPVPADIADRVMNSWSVGKALHEEIRGQYQHTNLPSPEEEAKLEPEYSEPEPIENPRRRSRRTIL